MDGLKAGVSHREDYVHTGEYGRVWGRRKMNYSVLMSVYAKDNPEYLVTAIESMLNQTVKPEQFVIVQDGNVGKELEKVLVDYQTNFPTVFTLVKLKENGGLANALNHGLQACRNELVARMDADDISLPQRCEKELEKFRENDKLVICGCNIDEFYKTPENVRTSRVVPSDYKSILKFMRLRQPFNHATVIYKKSKVLEAGGYLLLRRKEDFDLFSRMLMNGDYAVNIDESFYLCRANEENYARRKTLVNFKSAIYVYKRHLKRKGCNGAEFFYLVLGELFFLLFPNGCVKYVSDHFLRKRVANE